VTDSNMKSSKEKLARRQGNSLRAQYYRAKDDIAFASMAVFMKALTAANQSMTPAARKKLQALQSWSVNYENGSNEKLEHSQKYLEFYPDDLAQYYRCIQLVHHCQNILERDPDNQDAFDAAMASLPHMIRLEIVVIENWGLG